MSTTDNQASKEPLDAQVSEPQAEGQERGETTLITQEIGEDVPNPVAVEGVEGDQGHQEEVEGADDGLKTSPSGEPHPSGDKENPVVVDDEDEYEVVDDDDEDEDEGEESDSEEEEENHKTRLAAFYNARPEELEDDEEEYDEEIDEAKTGPAEPSTSAAVKRSVPDSEETPTGNTGETDGPSEAKKTKLD